MIVCQIGNESTDCEEICCCLACEKRKTCELVCEHVYSGEITEPQQCFNARAEEDKTAVIKYKVSPVIRVINSLMIEKERIEKREKEMRRKLIEAMEKYNIKSFENDCVKLLYVAPGVKTTIDTKTLKAEMPNIAAKYAKTSQTAASVRITVK